MKHPLTLITVALMAGIGLGAFMPIPPAITLSAAGGLLIALYLLRGGRLFLPATAFLFFVIGVILIGPISRRAQDTDSIGAFSSRKTTVVSGVVAASPDLRKDTTRIVLADLMIERDKKWRPVGGRLLLTVGGRVTDVSIGDALYFSTRIRRPHNYNNPGGFDYEFYLARIGISATAFVSGRDNLVVSKDTDRSVLRLIANVRDAVRHFYDDRFPTPEGAILKALVLGERGDIPDGLLTAYYRTGVGHVLAISGSNVGIAFFFGYLAAYSVLVRWGRFALRHPVRKWAAFISFFPVVAYTFLAGLEITALRATLMIAVFVAAILIEKEQRLVNTLVCAAFVILVVMPTSLFDPSFILSFVAVLSIILLYPPMIEPLKRRVFAVEGVRPPLFTLLTYRVAQFTAVSLAAFVGILPVAAFYFYRITPAALLLNFVVVPLLGPIDTTLSLFSVPFIFVVPELAFFLNLVAAWAASLADSAVLWTDALFPRGFPIFPPTPLEIVLCYGLLASIYLAAGRRRWARPLIAAILVIFLVDASWWAVHRYRPGDLSITFLSVGSGDSALIRMPDGKTMLVDGGGIIGRDFDVGRQVVSPFLLYERVHRIDYLVVSHPEADHVGGLVYIMENFDIGELWIPSGAETSRELAPLMTLSKARGIPVVSVDDASPDRAVGAVRVAFLNPPHEAVPGAPTDPNNRSVVFSLSYGRFSLLMTGDVGRRGIEGVMAKEKPLSATLVKAPHHGGSQDNPERFIRAVGPCAAVISCGRDNAFGLPGKAALDRYRAAGVELFRTDLDGAVVVKTDGRHLAVETMGGGAFACDLAADE
jgi:competence protein ComEC